MKIAWKYKNCPECICIGMTNTQTDTLHPLNLDDVEFILKTIAEHGGGEDKLEIHPHEVIDG